MILIIAWSYVVRFSNWLDFTLPHYLECFDFDCSLSFFKYQIPLFINLLLVRLLAPPKAWIHLWVYSHPKEHNDVSINFSWFLLNIHRVAKGSNFPSTVNNWHYRVWFVKSFEQSAHLMHPQECIASLSNRITASSLSSLHHHCSKLLQGQRSTTTILSIAYNCIRWYQSEKTYQDIIWNISFSYSSLKSGWFELVG